MNGEDLIRRAVDWFNENLKESRNQYYLEEQNLDVYQLFMAKKNGKPKDDFPSNFSFLLNRNIF